VSGNLSEPAFIANLQLLVYVVAVAKYLMLREYGLYGVKHVVPLRCSQTGCPSRPDLRILEGLLLQAFLKIRGGHYSMKEFFHLVHLFRRNSCLQLVLLRLQLLQLVLWDYC
jgi:hypothetical protein